MESWYDLVNSFDSPNGDPILTAKYPQQAVVLVLMYLSMGKDYPYNMAKNFEVVFDNILKFDKSEYGDKICIRFNHLLERPIQIQSPIKKLFGLNVLKHPGKLASLIKEMNTLGLVKSVPDLKIKRRPRKFYQINAELLQSEKIQLPKINEHIRKYSVATSSRTIRNPIETFLAWFEEENSERDKKIHKINYWYSAPLLDFITFLEFIKIEIMNWEDENDEKINIENKLSESMNIYIHKLLTKYDQKVYIDSFRKPIFPETQIIHQR
jgi:hypothetical protein